MIKGIELVIIALIIIISSIDKEKVIFNNLLLLFQFITRIPIKLSLACEKENFKRASIFFPVVGATIGIIEYGIFYLSAKVLPFPMVAVITVLAGIFITGGLHMDGLGDTCDGFFSFRSRERIIEIMKDSRVGSFGVLAMIFDVIVRIFGVYYIGINSMGYMLIIIPMISRMFTVFVCLIGKNAKEKGTGTLYIENTSYKQFFGAVILTVLISNLFCDFFTIGYLLIAGLVVTLLFNGMCKSKIGGHSGDTLGANNELVEICLFIICSVVI